MAKGLKLLSRVPFIPSVAVLYGMVAGILVLATPHWLFERTAVARALSASAMATGDSARILSAILAALLVSILLGVGLTHLRKLFEPRSIPARGSRIEAASEAEPFTPAFFTIPDDVRSHRPLFAQSDLGAPLMSAEAIFPEEDELILRDIYVEPLSTLHSEAQTTMEAAPETIGGGVAKAMDPHPEFQPEPIWTNSEIEEEDSVEDLLDRLEIAIERRANRTGTMPPFGGDVTQLREALGIFSTRH